MAMSGTSRVIDGTKFGIVARTGITKVLVITAVCGG